MAVVIALACPICVSASDVSKVVEVKSIDELKKDLSDTKSKNDDLNDRILKSNSKIIDSVKKLKAKKGYTRKQIKQFNKNESAISDKTELLTRLIEGIKDNNEKAEYSEKKLDELMKTGAEDKTQDTSKNSDNTQSNAPRVQLEQLVWLEFERYKLLTQTLDLLGEIAGLLP